MGEASRGGFERGRGVEGAMWMRLMTTSFEVSRFGGLFGSC